jgi:hypothetical protein
MKIAWAGNAAGMAATRAKRRQADAMASPRARAHNLPLQMKNG